MMRAIAMGLFVLAMSGVASAQPDVAADDPPEADVKAAGPSYEIDGRVSTTATLYSESASGEATPGNELAAPEDLMFTDLRARASVARDDDRGLKGLADFRTRLTGDELGARGYTGGSEYHLRRAYLEQRNKTTRFAAGRQLIGEADAIRIDGITANFDAGGRWRYGAFAGAFPNPFSRSLDTDYKGIGSASRVPVAGGAHASYKAKTTYGSLAAATVVPRENDVESPEPVRVFVAASGYTRLTPDIDFIHYGVFNLTGVGGAQVVSAQGTANWRASRRVRLSLGASRMSTYAVELYVRDLLETEDPQAEAGAPVQNNLALVRIANTELRAAATLRIGDRSDIFAHVRGRQRGALAATELPMEIAALDAESQVDVGGGARRRDLVAKIELAARGAFISGTRTRSSYGNLSARRSWFRSRLMSELVIGFIRFRDNCGEGEIACTGTSIGTTVRGGGTLIYRTRHILFLGDYRAARLTSRVGGESQPTITSHSVLARAQYSF